jgi:hypothetical protein
VRGLTPSDVAEIETGWENALELEKPSLQREPASEPTEAVRGHDAVARHDERKRVSRHQHTHVTRIVDACKAAELAVGGRRPERGDLAQRLEDAPVRGVDAGQVELELEPLPLPACVLENLSRSGGRIGNSTLVVPRLGVGHAVAGQAHTPEPGARRLDGDRPDRRVDRNHGFVHVGRVVADPAI